MDGLVLMGILAILVSVSGLTVLMAGRSENKHTKSDSWS